MGRCYTAAMTVARVLIGVPGLPAEKRAIVEQVLQAVPGVSKVDGDREQFQVSYDATSATVMDLLRALRARGIPAGML